MQLVRAAAAVTATGLARTAAVVMNAPLCERAGLATQDHRRRRRRRHPAASRPPPAPASHTPRPPPHVRAVETHDCDVMQPTRQQTQGQELTAAREFERTIDGEPFFRSASTASRRAVMATAEETLWLEMQEGLAERKQLLDMQLEHIKSLRLQREGGRHAALSRVCSPMPSSRRVASSRGLVAQRRRGDWSA